MDLDKNTAVIGAFNEASTASEVDGDASDNSGWEEGAAYVFEREDSGWRQTAYLKKPRQVVDSYYFGEKVAVCGDMAVVSGDLPVDGGNVLAVFRKDGDRWTTCPSIPCPDFDFSHPAIALTSDNLFVASTYRSSVAQEPPCQELGADYLFRSIVLYHYIRFENSWVSKGPPTLLPINVSEVNLATNGEIIALGAPTENSIATGIDGHRFNTRLPNAGAVFAFRAANGQTGPKLSVEEASGQETRQADGKSLLLGGTLCGRSSEPRLFAIRNDGDAQATSIAVQLTGPEAADYSIETGCLPSELAPGQMAFFTVSFHPAQPGRKEALLTITDQDLTKPPALFQMAGLGITACEAPPVLELNKPWTDHVIPTVSLSGNALAAAQHEVVYRWDGQVWSTEPITGRQQTIDFLSGGWALYIPQHRSRLDISRHKQESSGCHWGFSQSLDSNFPQEPVFREVLTAAIGPKVLVCSVLEMDQAVGAIFFTPGQTGWKETRKVELTPYDYNFRPALAVCDETVVIGHPYGWAEVWTGQEGNWEQAAILQPSNQLPWFSFHSVDVYSCQTPFEYGHAVAVDDLTIAVGDPGEGNFEGGINGYEYNFPRKKFGLECPSRYVGAVYIYIRENDGWRQQAYLKASDPQEGARFGHSLALHGDRLIVGAPGTRHGSSLGAAYVFTRTNGVWVEQTILDGGTAPVDGNSGANDPDYAFGAAVAAADDLVAVSGVLALDTDRLVTRIYRLTNLPDNAELRVSDAFGQVLSPGCEVLDFGYRIPGASGQPAYLRLENHGQAPLTLSGYSWAGPEAAEFQVEAASWPSVLAPGASANVPIFCLSESPGAKAADMLFSSNDAGNNDVKIVCRVCLGTPPSITQEAEAETLTVGDWFSFYVEATCSFPYTYRWMKDGQPVDDGLIFDTWADPIEPPDNPTNCASDSVVFALEGSDLIVDRSWAGLYWVEITDGYGTVISEPVQLIVYDSYDFAMGRDPLARNPQDGLTALVKYALGMDWEEYVPARMPQSGQVAIDGQPYAVLQAVVDCHDPHLHYRVETSIDLQSWHYNGDGAGGPYLHIEEDRRADDSLSIHARSLQPLQASAPVFLRLRFILEESGSQWTP